MQAGDLAEFSSEWVEPIFIDYRGWKIYELPPNGQGMAALEMLNIMATSSRTRTGHQGAVELHKKIEAMKLAYTDLYRYDADPRFAKVPVKGLAFEGVCAAARRAHRSSESKLRRRRAARRPKATPLISPRWIKTATSRH